MLIKWSKHTGGDVPRQSATMRLVQRHSHGGIDSTKSVPLDMATEDGSAPTFPPEHIHESIDEQALA